jgi:hypothetical protein
MSITIKTSLKHPRMYSSSPNIYGQSGVSTAITPVATRIGRGTYSDGKHVEGHNQDQEDSNPNGVVNPLTSLPVQKCNSIIVPELDCVGDGDQLLGCKDGVGKPFNRVSASLYER